MNGKKLHLFSLKVNQLHSAKKTMVGPLRKQKDAEMPLGEWNTVDLYCFGQTSVSRGQWTN